MDERNSSPPLKTDSESAQSLDSESPFVYPVYIYHRTYHAIFDYCLREAMQKPPREALGVILGFRRSWQGEYYIRVTDWATGRVEASLAYARLTPEGILEYRLALHDRYGANPHTPRIVGLWHSHPFGGDPLFSSTDLRTFFQTPYRAEGNIFFLIDPISQIFKVYMLRRPSENDSLQLEQVDWCTYWPSVPISEPSPVSEPEDGRNNSA